MSSMRWLKVVKLCYQNNHFAKMEKQFFRYHVGIFPTCCILKGCCGACCCSKPPNELDEVVKSSQIMLSKQLFWKNGKNNFVDDCIPVFPACCILKGCCGACCTKPPNELDEVAKSSQIMLSKQSFCKNGKTIFSIS